MRDQGASWTTEDQGPGEWEQVSDRGASDQGGASDRGVGVWERVVWEEGIGERVISEQANLGASDRRVIKM